MSFRKSIKRIGRKVISNHEKYVTRWARPALSAAAGYFLGPVGSAAVTAATHNLHQYGAGVTMRQQGLTGLEARQRARAQAKRTTMYSIYAGGAGALGSGVTTLALGGSFTQSLGYAAFGQVGAPLLGLGSAGAGLLSAAPAVEPASKFITSLGQDPETGKKAAGTEFDWLDKVLGHIPGGAGGGDTPNDPDNKRDPNDSRNGSGQQRDANGNAVGGGDGSLLPLLLIGGALLFASA